MLNTVMQAAASNRERLGAYAMEVTIATGPRQGRLDSQQITIVLPDGSEHQLPGAANSRKARILRDDSFFEFREYDADQLAGGWQCELGRWSHFDTESRLVVIRRPDQLPGMTSVDPGCVVDQRFGQTFEDFLRTAELLQGVRLEDSEYGSGTIELLVRPSGGVQDVHMLFGADSRYLPVYASAHCGGEGATVEKQFEYQLDEVRNALLLKKTKTSHYPENSTADEGLQAVAFSGEIVVSVAGYSLLGDGELAQLRLTADDSWKLRDLTTWEAEVAAATSSGSSAANAVSALQGRRLLLYFNIGLGALVTAFLLRRVFRRRFLK